MRSEARTSSAGEAIFLPLTATRPARIHCSASRREHRPARAIRLATRSAPVSRFSSVMAKLARAIADFADTDERMTSFMEQALAEARAADEAGEVPVGCV